MAQFAIIENGEVVNVIEADDKYIAKYLRRNPHQKAEASSAENKAYIGGTFDEKDKKFVAPKPYDEWVLDTKDKKWVAPKEAPKDGKEYVWDIETKDWISIDAYKTKYKNKSPKTDKITKG